MKSLFQSDSKSVRTTLAYLGKTNKQYFLFTFCITLYKKLNIVSVSCKKTIKFICEAP